MSIRTLSALMLTVLVAACQSTTEYGGKKYEVTLNSEPQGAALYLVQNKHWVEFEKQVDAGAREPLPGGDLSRFRISEGDGVAPITTEIMGYKYVLIGELDGVRASTRIRATDSAREFTVALPISEGE